jgi:hypothetical protein
MDSSIRNDSINLHSGAKQEKFEKFMLEEVLPFFSKKYAGPTRKTAAFLTGQSLLKDTISTRKYLWITLWDGSAESVQGTSFEHALVEDETATETLALLRKLESFGERACAGVFVEIGRNSQPSSSRKVSSNPSSRTM